VEAKGYWRFHASAKPQAATRAQKHFRIVKEKITCSLFFLQF
jgi:hypothetical protein